MNCSNSSTTPTASRRRFIKQGIVAAGAVAFPQFIPAERRFELRGTLSY